MNKPFLARLMGSIILEALLIFMPASPLTSPINTIYWLRPLLAVIFALFFVFIIFGHERRIR